MTIPEILYHLDNTKYSQLYLKIINNALKFNRKKLKKSNKLYVYYENHHILPKSIFPEFKNLKDCSWNGVLLTAREHYICHCLLVKHFKKTKNLSAHLAMSRALFLMNTNKRSSKDYAFIKLNMSTKESTKKLLSEKYKGVSLEKRHGIEKAQLIKKQISESSKNQKKEPWSEERKLNVSGSKNHCALKVNIYNENNKLMFEANGNLKEICKTNNLPYSVIKGSYQNNGRPLFHNKNAKAQIKDKTYLQFEGWYAKKVI